jgi:hypothetical protein
MGGRGRGGDAGAGGGDDASGGGGDFGKFPVVRGRLGNCFFFFSSPSSGASR